MQYCRPLPLTGNVYMPLISISPSERGQSTKYRLSLHPAQTRRRFALEAITQNQYSFKCNKLACQGIIESPFRHYIHYSSPVKRSPWFDAPTQKGECDRQTFAS
ncbi:hypothetical protein CY34DRAFT_328383 [Suillus luteus UH-Slu-Lm8-n1]|uniref:Uncharacterized protein n=1 Tax=Suillus luteus UH-Slu-Lm8-n1 TaxID=930992 RepID=A0A0D0ANH6_9AGAM|nr:hypothetical protein CY34DRAFT_328383 [Suillus luteus UH-Slu-Lm8-n1]